MSDRDLAQALLQHPFTASAALIALIPLLSSCSDARPDPLAGALRASDVDSQIVQAAALDFLENGNCWEGSGKHGIVVIDETVSAAAVFSNLRIDELPPDPWKGDRDSGLPDVRARNEQAQTIDWHFSDQTTIRDVVLQGIKGRAIYDAAEFGKCITTFALPGIYDEGRRATVVFFIEPEYHGRMYVSSLHFVAGEWRVERRHDFEYL
jgi:hypothetical protein